MKALKSVGIVSEVSLGYGTPQILYLAKSLRDTYDADVVVLEPDQPERPPVPGLSQGRLTIRRLYTSVHPYSDPGRAEYCAAVAQWLNKHKPDVVVLGSFLGIPILPMLRYKPWAVIFYALEHSNGEVSAGFNLLKQWESEVDLFIYPDPDRAALDGGRLGVAPEKTIIVLNGSAHAFKPRGPSERNGRLFYGGLLSPDHTNAHYFLDPEIRRYPIDLYGIFDGGLNADAFQSDAGDYPHGLRYGGYLSASTSFGDIVPKYAFSIVMWAPRDEATQFACPNKFFEAIAAGVPPLSTPHPQCKRIIERFKLGLLIKDWSQNAFQDSIRAADTVYQTDLFDEMVESCLRANAQYLSWDRQFEFVAHKIDHGLKANVNRLGDALKPQTSHKKQAL
jgi:hypothetical protein